MRVNDKVDDSLQLSSSLFPCLGKPVGSASPFDLSDSEMLQATRHVLINCTAAYRFIQEFRDITKKKLRNRTRSEKEIDRAVHRGIVDWFKTRILNDNVGSHSKDLKALAKGPLRKARRFTAYDINGYRFRTLDREQLSKTKNSGVFGNFGTNSYASSSDMRPVQGLVPYYGKLVDIIELNYYGNFCVTLFKCEWANTINPRCVKKDALGFTSINFSNLIHTSDRDDDEPFIKADEAQLVYYVEDKIDKGWNIPMHIKPRDLFDMGSMEGDTIYESETFPYQDLASTWVDGNSQVQLSTDGVEAEFE